MAGGTPHGGGKRRGSRTGGPAPRGRGGRAADKFRGGARGRAGAAVRAAPGGGGRGHTALGTRSVEPAGLGSSSRGELAVPGGFARRPRGRQLPPAQVGEMTTAQIRAMIQAANDGMLGGFGGGCGCGVAGC